MGRIAQCAVLASFGAVLFGSGAEASRASAPALGVSDDRAFFAAEEQRLLAFDAARDAGTRFVRLTLDWAAVAPNQPLLSASDPADPAYDWSYIEAAVRDAGARRLKIVLVVVRAPGWAEAGSGPDPTELAAFMRAAARRFSGFYPDPTRSGDALTAEGKTLPEVRYWQVWNAPNRSLTPASGAAERYRRMLNAASSALKRVSDRNLVIAGGTARSGARAFWQRLLCLDRSGQRVACRARPRFDIAAHTGLTGVDSLRRLVRSKPLWLSGGTRSSSQGKQARSFAKGLFRANSARSAAFFWNGLEEGALRVFRFPFLVRGKGDGLRAWGIAPRRPKSVVIERRRRSGWRRVAAVRGLGTRQFDVKVTRRRGVYRARQGRAESLPWRF